MLENLFISVILVIPQMDVDIKTLNRVADVSRLSLTEQECEEFLPQLKDVLSSFREIQEIDTEGIQPSVHPIVIKNFTREDIPGKPISVDDALSLTKHKKDNYFKCPRIL